MGGRGSSSGAKGGAGISRATPQQLAKIESLQRNILKLPNAVPESLSFQPGENGQINYSYQEKRMVVESHVGKMVDPLKDKMYDRTTQFSGRITTDGALVRNMPTVTNNEYLGTRKQLLKQGMKIWDGT